MAINVTAQDMLICDMFYYMHYEGEECATVPVPKHNASKKYGRHTRVSL
jgi:hypothetical protein